ncbi:MAG: glycoside hydrolase family 16 protein [Burkholderiaceae bacterium]|jgi:hypothetical protein|nr:glycoside hydrolase family 16 protein [Burkholderiaceae bacterium]
MSTKKIVITGAIAALMMAGAVAHAQTLNFSGYTWNVRPSGTGGPGPNNWDPNNAWVDPATGWLHLRLTRQNGQWYSAEVYTQARFGFGRYQFWIVGAVDKLDPNVVFGLFPYPTADVGPDGTNEIDIEFSKWGNSAAPMGNYTVWPTAAGMNQASQRFPFALNNGTYSTQRFTWSPTSIYFQSLYGHYDDDTNQFASWLYQPQNPANSIAQAPMPVHINLWCFKGNPPSDGQPVEVIVSAFKFTPM